MEKKIFNTKSYNDFESFKKITKTIPVDDYEILTDDGWHNIKNLHETIKYNVYELTLSNGYSLRCADNHIVFNENYDEIFVKDLNIGDKVVIEDKKTEIVISIENLNYDDIMYDLELDDDSNHRYYTNKILSHNTYLAKQLAEELFGDKDALIRIDMTEYQEKHSISKLFGTSPGYIGYDEGGQLTEQIKNRPYSIILFDEIEKASKDVFSSLLQILDDGHMTDGSGRRINFKNCIIIMTTNEGVRKLQEYGKGVGFKIGNTDDNSMKKSILEKEMKKTFPPEFLNRVDEIIIFNNLTDKDIESIVKLELGFLKNRLKEINYIIDFDENVEKRISSIGFDELYGARPLKRAIQNEIEDFITEKILNNEISENKKIILTYTDKISILKK